MSRAARLVALAPAKVNLGLEIVARRPDGYHEIVSILQAVTLADRFEWRETGRPFRYAGPPGVPPGVDLVARALALAPDRDGWTGDLRVVKLIPAAAGLGGGSSDAALALRLALPGADDATLAAHAARLGSDVPFFLGSAGRALATGTGTTLAPLPASALWVVLVTPALEIAGKTGALYGALAPDDFTSGDAVRALAGALARGKTWPEDIPNGFLRQLLDRPQVRYSYDCLRRAGATRVTASGAGPTVFAVVATWVEAAAIAARVPADAGTTRVARSTGVLAGDAARQMALALRGRRD